MKANFDNLVNSEIPVLADFSAEWCGPCKVQSPILKELAGELENRIKIIKIDVDKNPEIAMRYSVQGVPTLMLFKNGQVRFRHSGLISKSQLHNAIKKTLNSTS